jgi:RHS repeat-associated protein
MSSAQGYLGSYLYDPYGNATYTYDTMSPPNRYRFSSKSWDANSGLYYYGYRFYDPNLQRWPNRDPLESLPNSDFWLIDGKTVTTAALALVNHPIEEWGQSNPYTALQNAPLSFMDPHGLWQLTIGGGLFWGLKITIGYNGGQWNYGAYVGLGEGFFANLDPRNTGCHARAFHGGIEGEGDIGLGPNVGAAAHVDPLNDNENWWEVSGSLGPFSGAYGTDGAKFPIVGIGEGTVIGIGGQAYY